MFLGIYLDLFGARETRAPLRFESHDGPGSQPGFTWTPPVGNVEQLGDTRRRVHILRCMALYYIVYYVLYNVYTVPNTQFLHWQLVDVRKYERKMPFLNPNNVRCCLEEYRTLGTSSKRAHDSTYPYAVRLLNSSTSLVIRIRICEPLRV